MYIRISDDSNPSNLEDFLIIRPDLETAVISGSPVTVNKYLINMYAWWSAVSCLRMTIVYYYHVNKYSKVKIV